MTATTGANAGNEACPKTAGAASGRTGVTGTAGGVGRTTQQFIENAGPWEAWRQQLCAALCWVWRQTTVGAIRVAIRKMGTSARRKKPLSMDRE